MKPLLLIDGDILAYKFAAASQRDIDWGEGVSSSAADLSDAKTNLDESITSLLKDLDADECVIALSDPDANFRKDLDPSYKAFRAGMKPPLLRRDLEAHLRDRWNAKWKPRLEGDDVLGIIATNPKLYPKHRKIIVSADKDMQTIPCTLYRGGELRNVSEEEADYYHLFQTLTGDRTDGYPGLPGVGPKKAVRLLTPPDEIPFDPPWVSVVTAYVSRGLTEADALLQARLARILRHTDYDYSKKEPILWQPN